MIQSPIIIRMCDRSNASKLVALVTGLTLFAAEGVNYSQIGPFFPTEASENKNISTAAVGLVTSAFDVSNLIAAVSSTSFISPTNQKIFYCFGAILSAICNGLFGMMVYISGGYLFTILCTVLRVLMGVGASLVYSTGVPLLVLIQPQLSGTITSLTTTSFGLGMIIGPVVGSLLYSLGGYVLPFISAAASQIFLTVLCVLVLPNKAVESSHEPLIEESKVSSKKVDKNVHCDKTSLLEKTNLEDSGYPNTFTYFATRPAVLAIAFPLALHCATTGLLDVALAPYLLDKFNVNGDTAGLYLLTFLGMYPTVLPILGLLVDRGFAGRIFLISCFEAALGYSLLSLPYLFTSLESKFWTVFCLIVLGGGNAAGLAPVYLIFEKLAYDIGFEDENRIKLWTAALSNASFALGRMLGSLIIGGVFLECFGFYDCCLVLCGLFIASAVLCAYVLSKKQLLQKIFYQSQEAELVIEKQET